MRGRSAAELLDLRICDPALGEGAFLTAVADALATAVEIADKRSNAHERVARACLHGVDIDRRAIDAARAATGAPAAHLRHDDALSLDWAAAFPDVFARGGFDAILANPPYIRQERLADKRVLSRFASYDGVADLYVYFIELAHKLLRPGGRWCVIVPNKWLTAAYGRPLRKFLADSGTVEGIADVSRSALFADADAFPCVVWGQTQLHDVPVKPERDLRAIRAEPGMSVADALRASGELVPTNDFVRAIRAEQGVPLTDALHSPGELVPRTRWTAAPWHLDAASDRALLERIERSFPTLADLVPQKPSRGVVTGCNRAFVIDRTTRDRLLAAEPAAAELIRPFVKGRDLRPWRHADAQRFILLVDHGQSVDHLPGVLAHLAQFRTELAPRPSDHDPRATWPGRKPGRYEWYELQDPVGPLVKTRGPRLLYQDIQTSPACALASDSDVVPDTTVWMLPTDDRVLLAILSSPVYGWYARRRFPPALNGAVRPKAAYLSRLPVPRLAPADRAALTALVDQRLAAAAAGESDFALDLRISAAVSDAYELSRSERRQLDDAHIRVTPRR
jgi:predicted RNA methylase